MAQTTGDEGKYRLSKAETEQFHEDGYIGPLTLCSPEEMADYRERIEEEVLATIRARPEDSDESERALTQHARHLDSSAVYELCSRPEIVQPFTSIFGDDLILYWSSFFEKNPGSPLLPWHQDLGYFPIEPRLFNIAWIAIDEATIENSCVQLIPGSHKEIIPHVDYEGEGYFNREADPDLFDEDQAIPMEVKPGEFFIFKNLLLHKSDPNTSDKRRLGLSVRVTVPFVKVYHDEFFPGHKNLVLHGEDWHGLNDIAEPPTATDD